MAAEKKMQSKTAIVKIAGKQHLAYKGLRIECEKLDSPVGTELTFGEVLAVLGDDKNEFGNLKAKVKAKVVKHFKGRKIIVFKKLRRHGYQRKHGHRQNVSVLEITSVA